MKAIHFPALHLTETQLNAIFHRAVRHTDLEPQQAINLLLGHITSIHKDLEELMDACEGTKYAQLDPEGLTWQQTPAEVQ